MTRAALQDVPARAMANARRRLQTVPASTLNQCRSAIADLVRIPDHRKSRGRRGDYRQ